MTLTLLIFMSMPEKLVINNIFSGVLFMGTIKPPSADTDED
jgi:hypothetical protein